MTDAHVIPVFTLFGETGVFPDVIHCERIRDRAPLHDWTIAPHRHSGMVQLFFMERGRATAVVDGTKVLLRRRSFLYVPQQIVHGFVFEKGCEGLVLSFPLAIRSGAVAELEPLADRLAAPFIAEASDATVVLMNQLATVRLEAGTFRARRLVALAQALLATVAEIKAEGTEAPRGGNLRRLHAFDELLRLHLQDGWTVAHYAAAMSITTGHLTRICRATTGHSASQHLESAIMAEASRLLAFTRLPVAEIGFRLGFDDPPYFSRRFRKFVGKTPSAYRLSFDRPVDATADTS